MPILTKSAVTKGSSAVFTIDKSLLASHPDVSGSSYYSNQANWKRITLFYKSSTGNQSTSIDMDATQATPAGGFLVSTTALDTFQIYKVGIHDFDNGKLEIQRASLTTAEWDVVFTPPAVLFSNTLKSSFLSVTNGGLTLTGSSAPYAEWGYLDTYQDPTGSGKIYFEFTQNVLSGGSDNYVGVSFLTTSPSDFTEPSGFPFDLDALVSYHGNTSVVEKTDGTSNGLFPYGTGWVQGDVVMMAVDYLNNRVYFGKNGTWGNAGNPTAVTGGNSFTSDAGNTRAYFGVTLGGNSQVTKASTPLYLPSGFTHV